MSRRTQEVLLLLSWGIPALVLIGAYVWLSIEHGTPRLWCVVVHESGRYTFGDTVLYYGHFLREVPTAVAFALFLLGISVRVEPLGSSSGRRLRRTGWTALALALALVGFALIRAAADAGWHSAALDLAQFRTRDDLVGFGTHWRYHWLSTLWFGAMAGLLPAVVNRLLATPVLGVHRARMMLAWGYFLVLTLVFGLSSAVFVDPLYVGHQAREILTHGPVTLLLGLGTLLAARSMGGRALPPSTSLPGWLRGLAATLVLAIPLYLAAVGLTGAVMEHGQTEQGLAAMVAAHYFEHSLDYLLVLLLLVGGLALGDLQPAPGQGPSPTRREDRDHARH